MVGIKSYGVYIPKLRLSKQEIARAWGNPPQPGEIAIGNFDEDSATMAVEAVRNCLEGQDVNSIGGLLFATTTPNYLDKQTASLIATVSDLKEKSLTMDFSSSPRAGTSAMILAADYVRGGAGDVIVAASDARAGTAEPGSSLETSFGSAAGAVMLGSSGIIAAIEDRVTLYDEFAAGMWRKAEEPFVKATNPRFFAAYGYEPVMKWLISSILERNKLSPKDISRVVLTSFDPRSFNRVARSAGFDAKQIQEPLFDSIGDTCCAHPLVLLAAALDQAKAGDIILLACFGDGGDALLLRATGEISSRSGHKGVSHYISSKTPVLSYTKFLQYRNLVKSEPVIDPDIYQASPTLMWRGKKEYLGLYGSKCSSCGAIRYPMERVCSNCKTKDKFEEVKLSKRGKIFTFVHDNLRPTPNPPTTMVVVDLEGGGRLYTQMADSSPDEIKTNLDVELAFRKFNLETDFNNYFWKCRLPR